MSVALRFTCLIVVFFSSQNLLATEIFENYVSARGLGMGNAFSSVVDDKDALFYNPAALDRIHGFHLTFLDPALGTDAADAYTTYQGAIGSNYSQLIHSFFGKQVWVGIQDSLALSMNDFAVAAYDSFNLSFNLHDPAYANLNFNVTNDLGIVFGTAVSLMPSDALRVGLTAKRITRYGGRVAFGPSILATLSNAQLTALINNSGTGYGADAGMLLELPVSVKPTFSLVWHDIGQTFFNTASGTTGPPPIDNEVVFGYSMRGSLPGVTVIPAVDFKHITMWNEEFGKRVQLGLEIQLPALSLRGGFNQGYYTAGVGLDFKYIRIDLASYGVELDTYPGQLEDRRYIVQATLDLNFDLNLTGGPDSGRTSTGATRPGYQRR